MYSGFFSGIEGRVTGLGVSTFFTTVLGLIVAVLLLALFVYMLFFKKYKESTELTKKVRVK